MHNFKMLRKTRAALLGGTFIAAASAVPAMAQDGAAASGGQGAEDNVIIVTATRRAESVQDIPLNIAAVGSAQIEEQGLTELSDLLPFVPGINIVDRGGRQGNPVIVRGLNVDAMAQQVAKRAPDCLPYMLERELAKEARSA